MNELLSDGLWSKVHGLAKSSSRKAGAVAYVTTDEYVEFGKGDVLVVDATDGAIRARLTDARLLERAAERGAKVYSLAGLHAKVMVVDGMAVIGSANMSVTSAQSLVEAAWMTDDPTMVGMARAFVDNLAEQAEPVDRKFLKRIMAIKCGSSIVGEVPREGGQACG